MDFPDLSEMDLDHWNGDLKLGSGVGQSKLIMSCGKASHKPSHTIQFPSLTSMGAFYKPDLPKTTRVYKVCWHGNHVETNLEGFGMFESAASESCCHGSTMFRHGFAKYPGVGNFANGWHLVLPLRDLQARLGNRDRDWCYFMMIPFVLAGERFWQEPSKGGTKSDFLILVEGCFPFNYLGWNVLVWLYMIIIYIYNMFVLLASNEQSWMFKLMNRKKCSMAAVWSAS